MTICAYDGYKIVCDSGLLDAENHIIGYVNKIHKLDDGRLMACAGDYQDAIAVQAWINENLTRDEGEKSRDPKAGTVEAGILGFGCKPTISSHFAAIIVGPDGDWCELEAGLYPYKAGLPAAVGSGSLAFKVAYSCVQNIEQAVNKAVEFNAFCGGPIKIVEIKPT